MIHVVGPMRCWNGHVISENPEEFMQPGFDMTCPKCGLRPSRGTFCAKTHRVVIESTCIYNEGHEGECGWSEASRTEEPL